MLYFQDTITEVLVCIARWQDAVSNQAFSKPSSYSHESCLVPSQPTGDFRHILATECATNHHEYAESNHTKGGVCGLGKLYSRIIRNIAYP